MSKNDTPKEIQQIFARVNANLAAPSPYLKTRVLARLRTERETRKTVWFWRTLTSALGLACLALVALVLQRGGSAESEAGKAFASQPYVIHVDLTEEDSKVVRYAEVELPPGVEFASKDDATRRLRRLKLPLAATSQGKARLPFVVRATEKGTRALKVRIFAEDGSVLRENTMSIKFAATDSPHVL